MRVVVIGATGNHGTSLLRMLADEPRVESVLGLARRLPALQVPKVEWGQADITSSDLVPLLRGADAVVHLAWLIQPSREPAVMRATNVDGSARVFRAVAEAKVPSLVYASSVGAYSPGPKDRAVDERWPTDGIPGSPYSGQKAAVERQLDTFEQEHPEVRVVRLRPALTFKREAASEVRRLFAGPFLPAPLIRRELVLAVPRNDRLKFQAVHSLDLGDAYRLAVVGDARGAFNVAADPVLDPDELGRRLGAPRQFPLSGRVLRAATDLSWRLRLQPADPGWVDLALGVPIMDIGRARRDLGWAPRHSAGEALLELLDGLRRQDSLNTPPLEKHAGGPLRIREFLTGVGRTSR